MEKAAIDVKNLSHAYMTYERGEGLGKVIKDFFFRKQSSAPSVTDVSFSVMPGEIFGLLGPNGAGKTTIIKVLCGLISNYSGEVSVLDFKPSEKRRKMLKQIGVIFGQKSQLNWELPAADSLELMRSIYQVPRAEYKARLQSFCDLLDFGRKLSTPVRKLSLGERMKAELLCAMIHMPTVLFLDEPTIGLDIVSQRAIREFIKDVVKKNKMSVILTSHYMKDIEEMADHIGILQNGKIQFTGTCQELTKNLSKNHVVKIEGRGEHVAEYLASLGFHSLGSGSWQLETPESNVNTLLSKVAGKIEVQSISANPEPLDDIIFNMFRKA